MAWRSAAHDRWEADLRWPNCEHPDLALIGQAARSSSTRSSSAGPRASKEDLARLSEANMVDFVEQLAAVLEADAIEPLDV